MPRWLIAYKVTTKFKRIDYKIGMRRIIMEQWIEQVQDERRDFSQSFICLIPSDKMRHAFEQNLLQEVSYYHRVRFMTVYEWVLQETEAYRFKHKLRMIEQSEQVGWVLEMLEQMDESILASHQKRIATAEAIVSDFMFIRAHGLDEKAVNETVRVLFAALFTHYDALLKEKQATDYPQLLEYMLTEEVDITSRIVMYPNESLSRLEKKICHAYKIRCVEIRGTFNEKNIQTVHSYGFGNGVEDALEKVKKEEVKPDELYLVYSNADLLRTIYEKVEKHQLPATFADGIAVEWTEAYYFIETIIGYMENNQSLHLLKELVDAQVLHIGEGKQKNTFERILSIKGMTTGERFLSILAYELDQETMNLSLQKREYDARIILERMQEFHHILFQMDQGRIDVLEGMTRLLDKFFRVSSKKSGQAKHAIIRHLHEVKAHTDDAGAVLMADVPLMLAGKRLNATSESPGHVHISSIEDVGPLYRKHYCWFGMTTEEFYTKGNQSAFISSDILNTYGIRTEEERLYQLERHFEKMITNGEADHTLYFTTIHMERNKGNNAMPIFTKYACGREERSFPVKPLTTERQEHTLLQLEEEPVDVTLYTEGEEEKDLFTFSPTSAQHLVNCSRKFMYESILKAREVVVEPVEKRFWLTPNLRGDLYHEILEEYMKEVREGPVDKDVLLDSVFQHYEELYTPIYSHLVEGEKNRAREMLDGFIEKLDTEWQVVGMEEEFGLANNEPLMIEFPIHDSIRIQARGKIDRVDYNETRDIYRVVDYKTGKVGNANPLQIKLYEKAYESKYANKDIQFENESFFDFILNDERSFAREKDNPMQEFTNKLQEFDREWDNIDYKKVKSRLCSYCSFKHMCEIREEGK